MKASYYYYQGRLKTVWRDYCFSRALKMTVMGMIPDVLKYAVAWCFYQLAEGSFRIWQGEKRKAGWGTYPVEKVLLMRLDHKGDVLMTTPAIRAVRMHFPLAKIHMMTGRWSADVLKNNPYLDRILIYNSKWYNRGKRNFNGILQNSLVRLKALFERYDLAINFRGDGNNLLLTYFTGATYRVAHVSPGPERTHQGLWLTHRVPYKEEMHEVDRNLSLVRVLGVQEKGKSLDLFVNKEDEAALQHLFKRVKSERSGPIIVLHPGGGWALNRWPLERYAELADWLIETFQAAVIVVGGPEERGMMDSMKQTMKHDPIDAVGKTTIQQLSAILKLAHIFIGNDGGVMHVAEATQVPIVSLFGPSPDYRVGPLSPNSIIIKGQFQCPHLQCSQFEYGLKVKCSDNLCMKTISVDQVKRVVVQALECLPSN